MSTRQRPRDLAADEARRLARIAGEEIRTARRLDGASLATVARLAGISRSQLGRIERGLLRRPSLDQLCRAATAAGLQPAFRLYPTGARIRDRGQQPLIARLALLLGRPLSLRREVGLPTPGDRRAWDGRISGPGGAASFDAEARIEDIQALSRRVNLKQRDDPSAGVVILVVNKTTHNRRVLAEHRESLRADFPLDGAAIARHLRAGHVPPASGIILL